MHNRFVLPALALLLAVLSCTPVKYADRYGFLPDNDALANSEAFQRCLDGGGTIRVRKKGVYPLCRTLLLDSGTHLFTSVFLFFYYRLRARSSQSKGA